MTAQSERKQHAQGLFTEISHDYDRWANLLSFGEYPRWHARLVDRLAPALDRQGARAADVAAGTGSVSIEIARRYGIKVLGFDQNAEMLAAGRARVAAARLGDHVDLVQAQAEALPLDDGVVDALTHTYLLRYVDDPAATLAELARVVRPGGVMASLEFGVPEGPAYPAWWLWTRAGLPNAGRLAGRGWVETGHFLGPSIEGFWRDYPLEHQLDMWTQAGMTQLRVQRLSLGGGVIIAGVRS